MKRRYAAVVLLGAAVCCAALASPAAPTLSLSKTAAKPGERVVATAHGLPAGRRLRLVVGGRTLKRMAVTPRGAIRLSFRVPARRPASYRLTVLSGGHALRERLRILAPEPPAPQHAASPTPAATSSSGSGPAPSDPTSDPPPDPDPDPPPDPDPDPRPDPDPDPPPDPDPDPPPDPDPDPPPDPDPDPPPDPDPDPPPDPDPDPPPDPDPDPPPDPDPDPPPDPDPDPPPDPGPPTLVAAGDIACEPGWTETPAQCRQARTADLVESLAPDAVAVLGDIQYEDGGLQAYLDSYDHSWGAFKPITRPAVGNHEYEEDPERDSAPGYFAYFGAAAGDPAKGYYRWELGGWNIFVLNTGDISWARGMLGLADCWPVSCAVGSDQETWLRNELQTLPDDSCVLAYWHHPRISSGSSGAHRSHPETAPLVDALYDHGAELILTGHTHNYERFEPIDSTGSPDPEGVAHFVVGTGGRSLRADTGPPLTTTLRTDLFGVLELTLEPDAWSSRFVSEDGQTVDPAGADCHSRPTP